MTHRLRVLPHFPSNITGADGVTVEREGLDLVIKPYYTQLVQVPAVIDPDTTFFALWQSSDDSYIKMSFTDVFDAVANFGFMAATMYDPTGIEADVFNRANHYGTNTPSDASVTTAKIVDGALSADVTGRAKMADGFVTSAKIADGTIVTADLADNSVTSAKIVNGTIVNADLANMAQATVKGRASAAGTGAPADLTAAEVYAIIAALVAPLPQTAAGVGQIFDCNGVSTGSALTLPAGGTWFYSVQRFNTSTAQWHIPGAVPGGATGTAAGGTTIFAGAANVAFSGFAWRIA